MFNQNISLSQVRESTRMLCFAAKWRGERPIPFFSEFHHGRPEMLSAAHEMISKADVLVHYNGRSFDVRHLNREFLLAGMKPPAPFQQIDLLSVVRNRFRFPSNKLAYVSEALGIGGKVKHSGHEMWVKCLAGNARAWAEMKKYNRQDVALLEDLHDVILPWISNHPHTGLNNGVDGCPNCASEDLRREGYAYTSIGKFQRYQCRDCGTWLRSGKRLDGASFRGVTT